MITAREALQRLREGNRRFVADARRGHTLSARITPSSVADRQEPVAILLGCSDSRVPAELVFDQGLGDLFVIRVAGNIVAATQIGSVEFAADRFGARLVVVLGHSRCGAILATLEELQRPSEPSGSRHVQFIVDRIRPVIEPLLSNGAMAAEAIVEQAVRDNVRRSVDMLQSGSTLLEQLIRDDGLLVVGAEYSLETGVVDFFDVDP
jgi:carbonic anhydrase